VQATGEREPAVDDRVTVSFSLQNVAEGCFELASTFVGLAAPADDWRDSGEGNIELTAGARDVVKAHVDNLVGRSPRSSPTRSSKRCSSMTSSKSSG
jgi:hypothetical protein